MLAGCSISKKIVYERINKRKESGLGYFSNRLLQRNMVKAVATSVKVIILCWLVLRVKGLGIHEFLQF